MGCIYTIYDKNGNVTEGLTYLQLVAAYESGQYGSFEDILYSRNGEVEAIKSKLLLAKHDFKVVINESKTSDEPDYTDGRMTTLTFIDSPYCIVRGKRPVELQNDDDFKIHTLETLKAEGLSDEQALQLTESIVLNWKTINGDSKELHSLLNSLNFYKTDFDSFLRRCTRTKFENVAASLFVQIRGTKDHRNSAFHSMCSAHKITDDEKTRIIQGVNLLAKLNGINEELIGHMDNIVIDTDGDLHIYNYKITSLPTSDMTKPNSVKWKKYLMLMALLKQVLAYNGYDVRNTTLHIIPIRLFYNDDYSEIKKVEVNSGKDHIIIPSGQEFHKYETYARHFIKSNVTIKPITGEVISKINLTLNAIFPLRRIDYLGTLATIDEWIKHNYSAKDEAKIKRVDAVDHVYELYLTDSLDEAINITDSTDPLNNKEIREHIRKYLEKSESQQSTYLHKIIKEIRVAYRRNDREIFKGISTNPDVQDMHDFLSKSLGLYIASTHDSKASDGTTIQEPNWELISDDTLLDANILLFRHYQTRQIDVITLSDLNIRAKLPTDGNRTNIMGYFITDSNPKTKGLFNYKYNFANIEAVRTMVILNEILPLISVEGLQLGDLKILSTLDIGDMELYSFEQLNSDLFLNVIRIVKDENKKNETSFKYTNNFVKTKYVDPIDSLLFKFELCINSAGLPNTDITKFKDLGFLNLEKLSTKEQKRVELREIIKRIFLLDPVLGRMPAKQILNEAKSSVDKKRRELANLYILTLNAYCYYSDIKVAREYKISKAREYGMTLNRVNNPTYQGITTRFINTIDDIAAEVRKRYNHIYTFTMEFYDKQGFGSLRTSGMGDNSKAFQNLYKRNKDGKLLMEFRNPYESDNLPALSAHEKKYLKQVLFEFAKIRSLIYGFDFNFGEYYPADDSKLIEFIKKNKSWYFNPPLEKAAIATLRSLPIGTRLNHAKDKLKRLINDPKSVFNELVARFDSDEEAEDVEENWEGLALKNKYVLGDGYGSEGLNRRSELLRSKPEGYFETNIENLLAHYLEKNIQVRELNKTLIGVKGVLLLLAMIGDAGNYKKNGGVEQTIRMTEHFVKLNFFNLSIMEPESQKIMAWLQPFRKAVSSAYIAGNIVSMFRDTFEGMWLNTTRMLTKYLTSIDAKSLSKAYKEVVKASFTSIRGITIIDELCKTYRLSNLDVARISEGLTTSRGGIMNIENWMYLTLRAPDFLNRMVLFVARAMKDGSWEAFDLVDNKLVYNWKKDKRYSIYADPTKKGTEEWKKQREAYYNAVLQYNLEHPDATIDFNDENGLPQAYSNQEIQQMRNLSNSIYGAYDKSMRAKYENTALGLSFAMFSTWMNGAIANYFAAPGLYADGLTELVLDTDGSGNYLFLDNNGLLVVEIEEDGVTKYIYDGTGKEFTGDPENDLSKVMKNVPLIVLGIIYTFRDGFLALRKGFGNGGTKGAWEEFLREILKNPMQAANLRKALSDLLLALLFYNFFKYAITPAYKNYKKDMGENSPVANAIAEVLYKSSSSSYDGFLGPVAMFLYLGEKTNPPTYALSTKVTSDLAKFTFGDKTFGELLTGNLAFFRSFGETYKAAMK